MKTVEYLLTKHWEFVVLFVIFMSVLLVPGYAEKLPNVLSSARGIYFICTFVGVTQIRIIKKTKRARTVQPICVMAVILSMVGFWCS